MRALAAAAGVVAYLLCLAAPGRLAATRVRALRRGRPGPAAKPTGVRWSHAFPRRGRGARRRARMMQTATVLTADLLAACLAAGAGPTEAADAVADVVGGPLGAELRRAVGLIRLGADPGQTWRELGSTVPHADDVPRLGRAQARAVESGTGAATAMAAEAARVRAERRAGAEAALARVGVYAAAPLGLCFLPAFVCLGVIPMIVDLASTVLNAH